MFDNGFPSRKYPGEPPPTDVNFLDTAIWERPKYIPNSRPVYKATPALVHDREGIILDFVLNDGDQRYIVGFESSPDLRVSVKMEKIRDWVSARTFEAWHWQKTKEDELRLSNISIHWKKKKQMLASKNGAMSREAVLPQEAMLQPGMGLTGVVINTNGPGRRRKISESQPLADSRRLSTLLSPSSKRGRGQISRTGQLGLAQIPRSESGFMDEDEDEDEDENENTETAIAMQLDGYGGGARISALDMSRSTSVSVELPAQPKLHRHLQSRTRESSSLSASITKSKTTPSQHQSHSSRQPTPTSNKTSTPIRPLSIAHKSMSSKFSSSQRPTPDKFSMLSSKPSSTLKPISTTKPTGTTRSTSPFFQTPSTSKPKTSQTRLSSFFLPNQTLRNSTSERKTRKRTATPVPQPEEGEEEEKEEAWDVERILDDETRIIHEDGTKQTYYLIKWVGDYDDTWEPSENVGSKLKKEYKKIKQIMQGPEAAKSAEKKKRKRRESEDRSGRGTERKRRTTTPLRTKSPLFMNEDSDAEEDEIAALPSHEQYRRTKSPVALRGTKSVEKSRSRSKSKTPAQSKSRSVSQSEEQDHEGDTTIYHARHETPVEERGLFLSRTPPTAVMQKAAPIDLRSSSETESERRGAQEPDQEE